MAYVIVAKNCTCCGVCEFECPNKAIKEKGGTYVIDPKKCTECEGYFDTQHCAAACPMPQTCIPAPVA